MTGSDSADDSADNLKLVILKVYVWSLTPRINLYRNPKDLTPCYGSEL